MAETSNPRALEVLRKAKLSRYEHGGGRLFVDGPSGARELVADFYNEDTREFIMAIIEAAVRPDETSAGGPSSGMGCTKCGRLFWQGQPTCCCHLPQPAVKASEQSFRGNCILPPTHAGECVTSARAEEDSHD